MTQAVSEMTQRASKDIQENTLAMCSATQMKWNEIHQQEKRDPVLSCTNPWPWKKSKGCEQWSRLVGKMAEGGLKLQLHVFRILDVSCNTAVYIPR